MRIRTKKWARPELAACPYYIADPQQHKGCWAELFPSNAPIFLELGCGKGLFLAELAAQNPQINTIGVDISADILGVARRHIQNKFEERPVNNLLLTRFNIEQIGNVFAPEDQIDRIYILFCNPWPRSKHFKRRLTHPRQLKQYLQFLRRGGEIHFKTDNDLLFLATKRYFAECGLETVFETPDLHSSSYPGNILTEHEIRFSEQGIPIKALVARLPL